MTREEAIKELSVVYLGDSERIREAKNMAIEALKSEPDADYKTLLIKLENAEDVIRGLREDLRDAREELRQRG